MAKLKAKAKAKVAKQGAQAKPKKARAKAKATRVIIQRPSVSCSTTTTTTPPPALQCQDSNNVDYKTIGCIERPLLPKSPWRGSMQITYASDCSGLDAGAMALQNLCVPFQHLWASEVDRHYMNILKATHPDVEMYFGDVSERCDESLEPYTERTTIYTSGFPCTAFSAAGNQMGIRDPSVGMLSFYVVLAICKVLPDMFILENVPEFATSPKNAKHFDLTLRMLRTAGQSIYNIYWKVVNSKDHGVPAQRRRLYIIGLRRDKAHGKWAWPSAEPEVGLQSIFDPSISADKHQKDMNILRPYALANLAQGLEMINREPSQTGPWVIDIGVSKSRQGKPTCNTMPTITRRRAQKREYFIVDRGLISESELMRCQGFDPNRIVVPEGTNRERMCEMVGNAMTVTVMQRLIRNGLRALNRLAQ